MQDTKRGTTETIEKPYEGWAILELMGHVQLAGYVQSVPMYGTSFCRINIPEPKGPCTCSIPPNPNDDRCAEVSDLRCPQHGTDPGFVARATQFCGGSSIYRMTPCTEDVARAMNGENRPVKQLAIRDAQGVQGPHWNHPVGAGPHEDDDDDDEDREEFEW